MNHVRKTVAWVCVLSTLFAGCYSSELIDPAGEERDQVYSNSIQIVVTKDGKKHQFDTPPIIADSVIVGVAKGKPVSIPLSDVSKISVETFSPFKTALFTLMIVDIVAVAMAIHTSSNTGRWPW